jgi:SnoaL-like protein
MLTGRRNIVLSSGYGGVMLGGMTPKETMQRYFATWRDHDFDALEALFAEDLSFRGPFGVADGPAACRRGLEGMARMMTGLEIRAMAADGADVITWFELRTAEAPPVPVANWSRVEDGLVRQIRVAFDPRPLL